MLAGGATIPLLSRQFVGYVETLSLLAARPLQYRCRSRDWLKQRLRPGLSVAADVQNDGRLEAPPTRPATAPRDAMKATIIKCGCRDLGGAVGRSAALPRPCVFLWEGAECDKTAERQAMGGPFLLPYVTTFSLSPSPTKSSILIVFSSSLLLFRERDRMRTRNLPGTSL